MAGFTDWRAFVSLIVISFLVPVHAAENLLPPQQIIQATSTKLQAVLEEENYKINFARANQLVDEVLEPYVDFNRVSALVLGKHWKQASKEQKIRFRQEFRDLLVRTYASAFNEYIEWDVKFLPIQMEPSAKKIIVKTEILQPSTKPVAVNYRMIKTKEDWKVYDVIIEGISLVTNYRSTFNNQIARTGSLDAVIKSLVTRNSEAINKLKKDS